MYRRNRQTPPADSTSTALEALNRDGDLDSWRGQPGILSNRLLGICGSVETSKDPGNYEDPNERRSQRRRRAIPIFDIATPC